MDEKTADAVEAARDLLRRDFRLDDLERRVTHIETVLVDIQITLGEIKRAADRWKGGFLVIVALGAVVGWITSIGGNIAKLVK